MAIQTAQFQIIRIHSNYLYFKRVLDIAFTLLFSPLLLLACVLVALAIKLDSPGPIFFRQKRIGLNGVEFEMLKFRSMHTNCHDGRHRDAIQRYMHGETLNEGSEHPYKVLKDDRITRVGRIIRKLSIDELPQFWNVLRGEMSLVGPRPPLAYEVELYSAHDWLRLSGKPGLTGPWQVYGRSRVPFHEMVELDIAYLLTQSLLQDLKLITLTVPVMLLGRGAA
jgi:lipopolysaccharide/colanic/teichoic acid biosynthesis glycosyltransferase